jgi:tetratricopeptide (TPR) repeat protein/DNA-binding winged helix-turn-helix (wHTH) protein
MVSIPQSLVLGDSYHPSWNYTCYDASALVTILMSGPQQIYRLNGIEIDLSRAAVIRDGRESHLRPKTLRVLDCLLTNRGRIVSKEELFGTVWAGAAVTEDTLTQCISDLRKLLGDDPRNPRYIRTLPKQGFTFIAAIEEVRESVPETPTLPSVDLPSVLTVREPFRVQQKWIIAALGVLLLAAIAFGRFSSSRSISDIRTPVLISAFENRTGRPDLEWMKEGLADMLSASLARSSKLSILPRADMGRPARATVLISGAYTALGDTMRVEVRMTEVKDRRTIGTEILTVDRPGELLSRFDGLALRTAVALQAPLPSSHTGAVAEARTSSLDAYRLYTLGVEHAQNFHYAEAIAMFERALEVDPNFHMAYARIGYTHAFSRGNSEAGVPFLKSALEKSAGMNERDRLFLEAWLLVAKNDFTAAVGTYRRLVNEYPDEISAYVALARLLRGEKKLPEAREILEKVVAIDPDSADARNLLGGIYFALGQKEQSLSSVLRYAELKPNEANAYDSLGVIYHRMGRYHEAIQSFRHALALKPDFEVPVIHLGNTLVHLGRYREAIRNYRKYAEIVKSDDQKERSREAIAWVHWKSGDAEAGLKMLGPQETPLRTAISMDSQKGFLRSAKLVPDSSPKSGRGARRSRRFETALLGFAALRSGQTDRALKLMKDALQELPEYYMHTESEECLADAYLSLNRLDEAVAEYRRVLGLHSNLATARYGLGVALGKKGDPSGARVEFRRFLEIWKDADRELPQYLDALRRVQ